MSVTHRYLFVMYSVPLVFQPLVAYNDIVKYVQINFFLDLLFALMIFMGS